MLLLLLQLHKSKITSFPLVESIKRIGLKSLRTTMYTCIITHGERGVHRDSEPKRNQLLYL